MEGLKAYILDCGYTLMDSNFMIALDTYMTTDHPDAPRRWYKCPTYAVLIKHPTVGNILFDMGSRVDSKEYCPYSISSTDDYHGTEENRIEHQLALAGIKPEEVKYVVVSHMHYDHIGNLGLFKDTAEFFISRAEMQYAFTMVSASRDPADHGFYIREEVITSFNKVHYIDKDMELFPGLDVILLPGHTPGVMGMIAQLASGTVLLASDAVYCAANYAGTPPGIIVDTVKFQESLIKIKELAKKYQATVWFGHDPDQFAAMKKSPDCY